MINNILCYMCEETTSTNANDGNALILIPILIPLIILFIIFLAYEADKGFSDITFIFKIPKKIMEKKKEKNVISQELTKYIKEIYAYHDLETLKRFIHTNKIIENKNDDYYQEVSTILKKLGIYEEYISKMGELKTTEIKKVVDKDENTTKIKKVVKIKDEDENVTRIKITADEGALDFLKEIFKF